MRVLYEDNHLIAVYKEAGVLTQGDRTGDDSLLEQVREYLRETYRKPGNVFVGLIHRLDRVVSGVVLFAKTSKGASRLSEQIRNHTIQKTYHAILSCMPSQKIGTLVNFLKKDEKRNVVEIYDDEREDALRAELDYEVISEVGMGVLVKINLKTGRPHQIRAQFSHIGCPIVGDIKYGAENSLPDGSIALCATSLSFDKATGDGRIMVDIPIPEEWSR